MSRTGALSRTCCFIIRAQAVPTEGWPAKSSSTRGVKMRTRHVFAGSFFGIVETLAGRLQNRRQVLGDALRLGHNASLDHLAGGRVLGDLSAEEEESIDFDCLGKWADRRREFRRGNCGLAHSKLL